MRRGHTGIGGWRNENPRHFRPRNGGNPHFRPPRNYRPLEIPRFPPPSSRSIRPQYHTHSENQEQSTSEHSDRNRYRNNRQNRHSDYQKKHHHGERQILPMLQQSRHDSHRNTFSDTTNCFNDKTIHVNSMGDVDHRQFNTQIREPYRPAPFINPWGPDTNIQQPVERSHNKPYSSEGDVYKASAYTGHRPPASDHYGCNPTHSFSTSDSSHTFSRSVDDTVDIVRRRLLNRNEVQSVSENYDNQNTTDIENQRLRATIPLDSIPNNQEEQPAKKRYQKQKHIEKSNCAKIKNKIVHQLFKMDKEKIHKLMDNPNSSHKFEYAISSLITESQNSFNRHMRSTAEKSLCSTSAEFMQNDNNTIYEDTFIKQMQCILDPQDTVFLEDIKPIVMAELTKVLQIDDEDDQLYVHPEYTHKQYPDPSYNQYGYEDYPQSSTYSQNLSHPGNTRPKSADGIADSNISYENDNQNYDAPQPMFHRRPRSKSYNYNGEVSTSSVNEFYRRPSNDNESVTDLNRTAQEQFYNPNTEQMSEEDDPFAGLDQQYHVAVDHDFIENDDIPISSQSNACINSNYTKKELKVEPYSLDKSSKIMVDIIDSQLQDTAKSPLKSSVTANTFTPDKSINNRMKTTPEISNANNNLLLQDKDINSVHEDRNGKFSSDSKDMTTDMEKNDDPAASLKSSTLINSRKRSIDQRPSHRKEKRKKVDSCQSEPEKQIINKNAIIKVHDIAPKTSEKCEASKSTFNLFFSKEENKSTSKDGKKVISNDKNFTEKHVKRKETPKKQNDAKRKDSTSSQPTSPIENSNSNNNQTPTKQDSKITLKTIDMFTEQPRKTNVHHAHRNTALTPNVVPKIKIRKTALTPSVVPKINIEKTGKAKGPFSRHIIKRHVAVQVLKKFPSKQTQTERKRFATKAVQTDLIVPERPGIKSNDAFERMKEIDLEIQVLLQEKFKLYNSIESKESGSNSMETLGMTVLNVDPFDEDTELASDVLTEDTIVDDFTNIPVEELEKIALGSVSDEQINETPKVEKRNRRRKISINDSVKSGSPASFGRRKNSKPKSPNISLIEQIITDDRPLEDIISLDDLEVPQVKTKSKSQKKQTARKRSKKSAATSIEMKDCSVVLIRMDFSQYINQKRKTEPVEEKEYESNQIDENMMNIAIDTGSRTSIKQENIFAESAINDVHIDMLDVSEDIIVGDNCEVKLVEDKEAIESVPVPISEEIILDNSQSSMEDELPAMSQGEECKVYDYSADENLRRDSVIVSGNADAVLAIECVETNFLAACLDGNVYYFNSEGQLITTLRGSNLAVTCLTIVKEKHGTTVYTGSLDSRIRYYDLETGLEKGPECNVLSPIQTMDRAWDTVFVGTRTGFVLQFECKNNMLIPVSSVKFSDQSILALRAMKEGPRKVLLVAARSENVTIKDAQTGLLLRTLAGPKMTVYTLLYEDGKVYCGTSSHQIHVFDYTSGGHVGTHEGGKGAVCLRATGGLLFAGCYDGCVYVYREGEGQPFAQIRGPSLMLLSLAVVGSKIIAGYKDRSLYIWKIPLCILQEMIL